MKLNGKEVIEIRPMTRREYVCKYNKGLGWCEGCIWKGKINVCPKIDCADKPAYIDSKIKMIVKVR